jgi:glyoxylase-like metal-dependent hydrolase (beta-lactamase superfamily II)
MVVFFLMLCVLAVAVPSRCETEIEVREVAEGLYFLTGVVCNVALLVTEEGVLVVDSGMTPSHGDSIIAHIERITDKPVEYLVLTHYHWDHVCGASRFPEEVTVIAHENLSRNQREFNEPRLAELLEKSYPDRIREAERKLESLEGGSEDELSRAALELENLRAEFEDAKRIKLVYPDTTYSDTMTIMMGGREIRLHYPGQAHTSGNTIVHFVDLRAVHMGDMLFFMRHPYIDWKAGSDCSNWIASLKEVSGWEIDIVIPGHGELTDRGGLEWKVEYLSDLRGEVSDAVDEGLSLEETKSAVKMDAYSELPWSYMLDAGVEAVYNELTGAER